MTTQAIANILKSAIASSQELLTQYSFNDELLGDLTTAFGAEYNTDVATDLVTQWQTGNFDSFPEIEVLSSAEINGADGAYSTDTNRIYISEEFLLANSNNVQAISDLVIEEYGHYIDAHINTVDAAGDEGDIFSRLVRGESFSEGELQQLKAENDQAIVNIDGQEIEIEQREASVNNLPESLKIKGDLTNLYVGDFNGDGKDDFLRQEKGSFDNDNVRTADIFLSDGNGGFSRIGLPESFHLKGDLTNLHIGDFDGDGFDDFLRQEKGRWDDDNNNTANIFFSNGNGTFSKTNLPENFDIKGDLTNLHVGDFNGDGLDDFLRQEKAGRDDDSFRTAEIFFSNGDGNFFTTTLPENFDIKGDLTNLHVGDFNGDGLDDFLRQGKTDSGISDRIFFSNGDGSFSQTPLPSSILSPTSNTNTTISDIGDFNGDGKDDLLIQQSRTGKIFSSSFTVESTAILFSDGDGSFSNAATLFSTGLFGFGAVSFEGFDLKQSTTNLHIGDFDGNGVNELLRQEKGSADNDNVDTAQIFSDIGFNIIGKSGDDSIDGGVGNDILEGRDGNDTLNGNLGNDTLLGEAGNDSLVGANGNDLLDGGDGNDSLVGANGNDLLDGGDGNDSLFGGDNKDTLLGGDGDDFLDGGRDRNLIEGGNGDDTLIGGNVQDTLNGGAGNDILNGGMNNDILDGGSGNDSLIGGNGGENNSDTLFGGEGNDTLMGEAGEDILEGGAGDDILDGGDGNDLASYQGNIDGFDITINDDGSITVTDIDTSDGDEGTDTLTNISQLAFGGSTRLGADSNRNTVLGIAGVHESTDNSDTSSSIVGGSAAATNFVIDIEGTTGLGLDFDTTKLANFINDISLPDQGIENERLATNLLLDAAGGIAGSIPFFGGVASTGIAIGQTLSNYAFDLAQVEAQKQAAIDAVNNPDYNTEAWGTITQTSRDMVVIEDFQIGVDNLFLPSLSNVANVGYATKTGTLNGQDGVFIEAQIGNETSNLVFIVNNYEGEKNKVEFGEEITNLLSGTEDTRIVDGEQITEFSGTMIGTFNQTPIQGEPFQSGTNQVLGTFAGDHILGKELVVNPIDADSGTFELLGFFGDDFIQGSLFNDVLNGGFNSETPTFANITYEDDGFDILQGGKGDDILFGGTGNDVLDGGGLIYNQNPQIESEEDYVIGVIENDGTDILTGGSGNDTFVFNTVSTGIDIITDFTLLIDKIQINQVEFGATDKSEFSFDQTNGALSFGSQQFATLQNFAELENFDVNRDIQFA